MKIRTGFVSNSSSSSFVIGVPSGTPLDVVAFNKAIWGTEENINFGSRFNDPKYPSPSVVSYDVAKSIIGQIEDSLGDIGKLNLKKLINVVRSDIDYSSYEKQSDEDEQNIVIDWKKYEQDNKRHKTKIAKSIMKTMTGMDLYCVEFGDENGRWESEVEHGDALTGLKYVIRYSNH